MVVREYARNWCDYFTPCIFKKDVMIGSFECSKCHYFGGFKEDSTRFDKKEIDDYSKYFRLIKGVVNCKKEE